MFEQLVRHPRDHARLRATAYARGLDALASYLADRGHATSSILIRKAPNTGRLRATDARHELGRESAFLPRVSGMNYLMLSGSPIAAQYR